MLPIFVFTFMISAYIQNKQTVDTFLLFTTLPILFSGHNVAYNFFILYDLAHISNKQMGIQSFSLATLPIFFMEKLFINKYCK